MKTQILHLEPHDDAVSARDKMGSGQAERILLVWPERSRMLNRRLDLVLLQRHGKKMGAQLAFVARDHQVRFYARQLSIPVYRTPSEAKKASWTAPAGRLSPQTSGPQVRQPPDLTALRQAARPPKPAWPQHPAARLAMFALGVLALLSIAAVLGPEAEIDLTPKTISQEIILDVQAGPESEALNLSGRVPVRPVRVIVEGRDSLRTSGTILFQDQTAAGQVVLTNLSDRPVAVPSGSIVRTLEHPAVRFATSQDVRVPSGPGQTVTLPVRAVQPGRAGNLPAGRLAAIEGPLGLSLTATNPAPTRGGSDRRVPAPSQSDYERLEAGLRQSLRLTALEELARQIEPDGVLLPATLVLSQVVEQAYEPAASQPADWLHLGLRLEFEVLAASGEDLRSLAAGVLDANLPEGYQADPGSLRIEPISTPSAGTDGITRWLLKGERRLRAQLAADQAVHLARGLAPPLAQQRLAAGLPLASPPRILLAPSWWPRLPFAPFRIEVKMP